ncbi:glycosyltransferase family 1 protein [Qipengyuania flava]|uniref:glycosyltransferase family 4 protein n=1 Tax=Qipengyuania flava TaxID=192812 RepID=UPI000B8BC512|nr:glycosyltransferase family 4 protein [Qipengyuania flava]ASP29972.1 glycosyltransferase family 1 protein [Qipengyuania flava]
MCSRSDSSTRSKSIVILASQASSLRNFRGSLIESLLSLGFEVHTCAPELSEDKQTHAWLTARGARCHDVPLVRTGLNVVSDLRTVLSMYRLFREIEPSLILSYTIKPVIWGLIAGWMARVPYRVALITGLGYAFPTEARGLRAILRCLVEWLYGIALSKASLVFFQNPDDMSDFREWGILSKKTKSVIVNGSGVDVEAFPEVSFPTSTKTRFLLIARLLWEKGIDDYVEAARILQSSHADAEFHLVGPLDANPGGISEEDVTRWEQAGWLTWHGSQSDVRPFISDCHVFVLPSKYREGTPRTILEAMAMGRAIITTDSPGCRETVVEGFNGFLLPPGDANALASAMLTFIDDPHLISQMGRNSRVFAEEKYDVRKVNQSIIRAMDI